MSTGTEIGPIQITDTTGQRNYRVDRMPSDTTIDEVVQHLLAPMQQPRLDPDGRPLAYTVRHEREGRLLGGNERIADVVQPNDTLRLMPTVEAGA